MKTITLEVEPEIYRKIQKYKLDIRKLLKEFLTEKEFQVLSLKRAEEEGWDSAEELFKL